MDQAELDALAATLPEHYRPLVAFLAATGARWGEATALNVEDVDLALGLVRVTHAWKRTVGSKYVREEPKTIAGTRTITLYPHQAEMLRPLVAGKKRGQLIFTTPKGTRITHAHFYDRVWKPACDAAGLDPRPGLHSLRHSHATWMVSRGVPLPIVQVRLGHEDVRTTVGTYTHVTPEIQRAALQAAGTGAAQITAG
jgi:integrase